MRLLPPLSLLLLLAACGDGDAPAPAAEPPVLSVTAAPWEAVRLFPERDAPAAALGKNETRLAAEVSARILAMPVDVGDQVARGQVVARLDARDAELALARAEAALAQAEARLAQTAAQAGRARALREKNFISAEALTLRETELAAAEADRRAALAARDTAARGVEKCVLRAPFPAVVRARAGQVGELAAPGVPLLTLADIGELHLVARVQVRDVESLKAADGARFLAPGHDRPVRIQRISPAVSREARNVEVRLGFEGPPPPPGTEGRLVWRETRAHAAPELILRRGERQGVFVADQGKARFVPAEGAQEGRPAPLDLPSGAMVVLQGRHALQDGMAIRVEPPKQ